MSNLSVDTPVLYGKQEATIVASTEDKQEIKITWEEKSRFGFKTQIHKWVSFLEVKEIITEGNKPNYNPYQETILNLKLKLELIKKEIEIKKYEPGNPEELKILEDWTKKETHLVAKHSDKYILYKRVRKNDLNSIMEKFNILDIIKEYQKINKHEEI
jgi:hypothetical protein